jgi:hypothetical protein
MQNRPNGGGNRPEPRARGNAPQLHEKYKSMARDAQLAGDRVQTEYYLQFADHYYRILNENRPRFDENRPRQGDGGHDGGNDDYDDDEMMGDEGEDDAPVRQQPRAREARPERDDRPQREARPERDDRPQREARPDREDRPQREPRGERDDRPQRDAQPARPSYVAEGEARPARVRRDADEGTGRGPRGDRPMRDAPALRADADGGEDRPREDGARENGARDERVREERPRARTARNGSEDGIPRAPRARAPRDGDDSKPGIDLDRLPPAISRSDAEPSGTAANGAASADAGPVEEERPRPVRRTRRPREDTPAAA